MQKLSGKSPNLTVNPDEVVALGAAVQAGVLAGAHFSLQSLLLCLALEWRLISVLSSAVLFAWTCASGCWVNSTCSPQRLMSKPVLARRACFSQVNVATLRDEVLQLSETLRHTADLAMFALSLRSSSLQVCLS